MKILPIIKSTGLRQSIMMLVGNTVGTAFSAIALIIFSRILGPEKFGEFTVGFSLVMILVRLNDLGLNTAVLKFGSSLVKLEDKNFIYTITLKYKLILSVIIMSLGLISYKFIASLLRFENEIVILLAFSFGLLTVYYEQLLSILQSLHLFSRAIIVNAIQAIFKLLGAAIFFLTQISSSSFTFLWYISAPVIPVLFSLFVVPKEIRIDFRKSDVVLSNKIAQLAKHSAIGLISAGLIENIDVLFLQKHLSTYETGLYGGVSRIALLFSLVAYSLGNVLYPRVAKYKSNSDILSYLVKASGIVFLAMIGFSIFVPFAQVVVQFTIGSQYISGVPIMLILTAASFFAIASIPFIALFYSFNANWYFSLSGILQLVIVVLGNYLFVPVYGLEAAAWTRLASRIFLFVFTVSMGLYYYYRHYVLPSAQKH